MKTTSPLKLLAFALASCAFTSLADDHGQEFEGGAWTRGFNMDSSHGEPRGYLCFTQTPDGMIHLLSSAIHYQVNLAWLKARPPAMP